MFDSINAFDIASNQAINIILLIFALFRIYLEVIEFEFCKMPVTKAMFKTEDDAKKFHRSGLILSVGYVVLSAPFTLLA